MKYNVLKIEISKDNLQEAIDALIAGSYESLVIDDPEDLREIEEHPEWYKFDYIEESLSDAARKPVITIYFTDDEEGLQEAERAKSIAAETGADCSISTTGDDSEWLYKWQENFKPTKVGERIVVKPSWEEYSAKADELVIEMDPGMAFGSGLHETTTLCIKALENVLTAERGIPAPSSIRRELPLARSHQYPWVLDVGTGTGILAIAAMLLGAEHCLGIDIDADAVRIAKENVERNGLTDKIGLCEGDLMAGVDFEADIIVANLMADLVIRLSPAAAEHLKPGGIFISSGILDIKEDIVAEAVREAGFEIIEVLHDGEWCAIVAKRK